MGGRFRPELVAGLNQNGWQFSPEYAMRFVPQRVPAMCRNRAATSMIFYVIQIPGNID